MISIIFSFVINLFKKLFSNPTAIIKFIFILVLVAFAGYIYYKYHTIHAELDEEKQKYANLESKYTGLQNQLIAKEAELKYYERNAEIASYAKEEITNITNNYHNDTQHTKEIIHEFSDSKQDGEAFHKLIKKFNNKFKDM